MYVKNDGSHPSLTSVMSGCPIAAGDTIHFANTPFDMFDDAGGDALTEMLFDSVMPETMNPFSAVPSLNSQGL